MSWLWILRCSVPFLFLMAMLCEVIFFWYKENKLCDPRKKRIRDFSAWELTNSPYILLPWSPVKQIDSENNVPPPFFKRLGDLRVPVESGLWVIHHLVFCWPTPPSHCSSTQRCPLNSQYPSPEGQPPHDGCSPTMYSWPQPLLGISGLCSRFFFPPIVTWKVGRHLHWGL